MNRTKDTIDLAYEELERAIAEAEGYQSDELSEAEAVGVLLEEKLDSISHAFFQVGAAQELAPMVGATTPNLLDTALYEVSNTSSSHLLSSNVQFPYPLRPVTSLINFIHLDFLSKVVIASRDTF